MTDACTAINPYAFGANPWFMNMANFANAYSSTDAESFYNSSIFNPYCGCYGIGMFGMMNPFMTNRIMNPAAYDAMKNGINPMGSLYFNQGQDFQRYNTQQAILNNGIDALASYAKDDNQDDFSATYNKMVATEKYRLKGLLGKTYNDAELTKAAKANINQAFQNKYQVSLAQALEMNGDSPFKQGIKDALAFGGLFSDDKTVSQNIAMVNDAPMNSAQRRREKHAQALGFGLVAGGAVATVPAAVLGTKVLKAMNSNSKLIAEATKDLKSPEAIKAATETAKKSAKYINIKTLLPKLKTVGKWGIIAAGVAAGVACIWNFFKK